MNIPQREGKPIFLYYSRIKKKRWAFKTENSSRFSYLFDYSHGLLCIFQDGGFTSNSLPWGTRNLQNPDPGKAQDVKLPCVARPLHPGA